MTFEVILPSLVPPPCKTSTCVKIRIKRKFLHNRLILIASLIAFLNKGVISGAYSAYDLTDFLLALVTNSPLRIYALSD